MGTSAAEDIAVYIASKGHGTLGTNIFVNKAPDGGGVPDDIVSIHEYFGEPSDHAMAPGAGAAIMEHPGIQVRVRWRDLQAGQTKIYNVYKELDALKDTLNGTNYYYIQAVGPPMPIQHDERDRVIYIANFIVSKSMS